jgi:protein SCO1/2
MANAHESSSRGPMLALAIGHSRQPAGCVGPANGPNSEYFPNVLVVTHENRKALFYDDLLRSKTVLINFMSLNDELSFRHAQNLRKVQNYIGPRMGRDVFIYSITVDPQNDTAEKLERFAASHDARPGWLFLTGPPEAIQRIKNSFFARGSVHQHEGGAMDDCSMSMIRYGNEAVGLWGTVPSAASPESIAQRVSWVEARPQPAAGFKRRGPVRRDTAAG